MNNGSRLLKALARAVDPWASLDTQAGIGPHTVKVTVPAWKGRLERDTFVTVTKENQHKIVYIDQTAVLVNDVIPKSLIFSAAGEAKSVTLSTNAQSLIGVIAATNGLLPSSVIRDMTIGDITITVDGTSLQYGVPSDPGATGLYTVVFTITMPKNETNNQKLETFTINGQVVTINQLAGFDPYLYFEEKSKLVPGQAGTDSVGILSNTDYDIEIITCTGVDSSYLDVDPTEITLEKTGEGKTMVVKSNKNWRIE